MNRAWRASTRRIEELRGGFRVLYSRRFERLKSETRAAEKGNLEYDRVRDRLRDPRSFSQKRSKIFRFVSLKRLKHSQNWQKAGIRGETFSGEILFTGGESRHIVLVKTTAESLVSWTNDKLYKEIDRLLHHYRIISASLSENVTLSRGDLTHLNTLTMKYFAHYEPDD